MAELHRDDVPPHDQRRTEARPESEEEHRAPLIAPERLHRRVVDDLHGAAEGRLEVEPDPASCQIARLEGRMTLANLARVPD